ncbi:ubiquitin carboxyl-terminal hydrolase 34 isoform X1 [Amia ocellicauda]|uniref:ubiquitin carboxyl-terminal hydrolase 34 isoform X1 n=1 Tax=Amia ocellicauda TaxID=2972642 RepID=UPI003464E601
MIPEARQAIFTAKYAEEIKHKTTLLELQKIIMYLKNCIKLLCEDPAFAEYIKCILMDERTFLNNNMVYSFLTCFLLKVQSQVLSGSSCANLINILVTSLINEYHNLEPELTSQRLELCKTSGILNADLRAFILMLSVHTPKQLDPALIPALQDLLTKCRACLQQRSTLIL